MFTTRDLFFCRYARLFADYESMPVAKKVSLSWPKECRDFARSLLRTFS